VLCVVGMGGGGFGGVFAGAGFVWDFIAGVLVACGFFG